MPGVNVSLTNPPPAGRVLVQTTPGGPGIRYTETPGQPGVLFQEGSIVNSGVLVNFDSALATLRVTSDGTARATSDGTQRVTS